MSYALWILLSIIKYPVCLYSAILTGSLTLLMLNLIGGILGTILFTYIVCDLEKFIISRFPKYFRKFSTKNRFLVRLRRKFGIVGISILTPVLLGPPLGILLLLTLTTNKARIIKTVMLSMVIWTLLGVLCLI